MEDLAQRLRDISTLFRPDCEFQVLSTHIDCIAGSDERFKHAQYQDETSAHNYPEELVELIRAAEEGWALDCGSGSRDRLFPNVVNFEIAPFRGVDVVGVAEDLPFEDGAFDLVASLAVLEHVRDPFKAVAEMQRVLKKGGALWIDTAFMQPYHGFPSHYYNMTQEGLRNLLNPDMEIVRDAVPRYGTPIWSLSWIVARYADALPPEARQSFLSLHVSELLQSPELLCQRDFATLLPESARKELAATVSVLARKR